MNSENPMTMCPAARPLLLALAAVVLVPAAAGAKKEEPAPEPPTQALEVGTFRLREPRAAEGNKLRLAFVLHLEVSAENAEGVEKLLESHKHRVRDAVYTAIRTCRQREFQDPALDLFRKRIRHRLKWVLPALKIERLLISGYEFLQE